MCAGGAHVCTIRKQATTMSTTTDFVQAHMAPHGVAVLAQAVAMRDPDLICTQPTSTTTHSYIVLHCSCNGPFCFKVATWNAISKALKSGRDPRACPAHDGQCSTHSRHVAAFYAHVLNTGYRGPIIWDWHDLPGFPSMHFDATLFVMEQMGMPRARRFEIDGRGHFLDALGSGRLPADKQKDTVMINLCEAFGVSCLRCHFMDTNMWSHEVSRQLQHCRPGVHYTPSYIEHETT